MGKLKIYGQLQNMAPDIWSLAKQVLVKQFCQMPLYLAIATGAGPWYLTCFLFFCMENLYETGILIVS